MGSFLTQRWMLFSANCFLLREVFIPLKKPTIPAFTIVRLPFLSHASIMQRSCCVCFEVVSTIIVIIPNYIVNNEVGKK